MSRDVILQIFCLASLACISMPTAAQTPLRVGAAQVDITPPVGFRCGGGYGEVISTGVQDPLFAKALVLQQGEVKGAIVISDLLSVPPDLSRKARRLASQRTGIPFESIVVAATHNHGSPEFWGSLRDIAHEQALQEYGQDTHEKIDYQAQLVDAWVEAIARAHETQRPAVAELVVAEQMGLAFNRRFRMKDGSVRFNPGVGNPNIVRAAGPVDTELPVLFFRQRETPQDPIASLTTFAMHTAVHGGTTFSGDFPAILQTRLRQELGSGFISLFAEGTAGDINHIDVTNPKQLRGRPEVARIGNTLADTITASLESVRPIESPSLAFVSKTAWASFQPVSQERYTEARDQLLNQQTNRLPFLELVAAWRDLHRWRYAHKFPEGRKPLEVQAIKLDSETAIIALPHEIFVDIGLSIKATSPFKNTIVASLSGDVDYYIPTRRAFAEGSYEVTTCPLDAGCGEILLDCAREVLLELNAD